MYSPATVPSTLAEMLDFMQPMVASGLFDSVEYDDAESPTKIVCTQNGETILDMVVDNNGYWTFTPYTATGVAADNYHRFYDSDFARGRMLTKVFRCSSGACFVSQSSTYYYFAIGKTSADKTGFVLTNCYNGQFASSSNAYYYVSFGDDTSLKMYYSYYLHQSFGVADRTILRAIPVVGREYSSDYFTTVFIRDAAQFMERGEQIIGGKKYGCIDPFVIEDEELV